MGANIPIFAPLLATSRRVKITCFSFFRQTKSSVSNIMHCITPEINKIFIINWQKLAISKKKCFNILITKEQFMINWSMSKEKDNHDLNFRCSGLQQKISKSPTIAHDRVICIGIWRPLIFAWSSRGIFKQTKEHYCLFGSRTNFADSVRKKIIFHEIGAANLSFSIILQFCPGLIIIKILVVASRQVRHTGCQAHVLL